MTANLTIILRGPSGLADWAFRALADYAAEFPAVGSTCGIHNRVHGVSGLMRRTKTGFSINYYRERRESAATSIVRDMLARCPEVQQ